MPQPIWFQFWTLGSADSLRAACCGSMVPNGLSITIFGILCCFLGLIIAVFVMSVTHFSICSLCKCDLAPAGPCSCLAPLPMLSWLSGKFKIFPLHFKDSKIDIEYCFLNAVVNSCLSEKERFKGIYINMYTDTYNACSMFAVRIFLGGILRKLQLHTWRGSPWHQWKEKCSRKVKRRPFQRADSAEEEVQFTAP